MYLAAIRCTRDDEGDTRDRLGGKKHRSLSPALRTHGGFLPPPNGDRLLILRTGGPSSSGRRCGCVRNATTTDLAGTRAQRPSFGRHVCGTYYCAYYASRCGVPGPRDRERPEVAAIAAPFETRKKPESVLSAETFRVHRDYRPFCQNIFAPRMN